MIEREVKVDVGRTGLVVYKPGVDVERERERERERSLMIIGRCWGIPRAFLFLALSLSLEASGMMMRLKSPQVLVAAGGGCSEDSISMVQLGLLRRTGY